MNRALNSMLSLCQRAGKLVSGESNSEAYIRSKKAKLIILASDASNNTVKKFTNSSNYHKVPIFTTGTKIELGKAIGKENRAVITILDKNFSEKIEKIIKGIAD